MRISGLHFLGLCSIVVLVASCNGAGTSPAAPAGLLRSESGCRSSPSGSPSPSPIQHVVIMIQENRTFNDFFATFQGADGTTTGKAVANNRCVPPIAHKEIIPLVKAALILPKDLDHGYNAYRIAHDDGKMDAFDKIRFKNGVPECLYPYQYTDPSQIQPYWTLAQQYTLVEHMFTTQGSGSFTAHQDLIRGGTIVEPGKAMIDLPTCSGKSCKWGCDAPAGTFTHLITQDDRYLSKLGPRPCSQKFTSPYLTLRDLLDAKSVTWKYYVPPSSTSMGKLMSAFDVVYPVRRGPEWTTNVITPQTQILNDISSGALPAVSWLIPDLADSDHPGQDQDTGPRVGRNGRQRDRSEPVLAVYRDRYRLGRLGRFLRQPRAALATQVWIRRTRPAGTGDHRLAVCQAGLHLADILRVWQHS